MHITVLTAANMKARIICENTLDMIEEAMVM